MYNTIYISRTVTLFCIFSQTILKSVSFSVAVLLRGLDALTTEDAVLKTLHVLTKLPIKALRIGRDSLTNTSRGICYVEMNSVVDAMFLHNQLLGEPPTIDDKIVSISYYRTQESAHTQGTTAAVANTALAAAKWSHQVSLTCMQGPKMKNIQKTKNHLSCENPIVSFLEGYLFLPLWRSLTF